MCERKRYAVKSERLLHCARGLVGVKKRWGRGLQIVDLVILQLFD